MNQDHEKFLIPRHLEDKAQFFIWEADSAFLFLMILLSFPMFLGLLGLPIGAVTGYYAVRALSQLKELGGKQMMIGVLYWYTPNSWFPFFRALPCESHIREYIG